MLEVALLVAVFAVKSADLPPGAVLRLGDARWRAPGAIRELRFSADGLILTGWVAQADGSLQRRAWNAEAGFPSVHFQTQHPPEWTEDATPSVRLGGNRVLTAGPGNAGRVWDATTSRQLAQLTGHVGRVTAVARSVDAKKLATGSADGLVRIWDGDTFRPLSEPRGHIAPVFSIRTSADGNRVLTTAGDGTTRVWSLATGVELRAFATTGPVDFTPDGIGLVTLAAGGDVVVYDLVTGAEIIPEQSPIRPTVSMPDWIAQHGLPLAISPSQRMIAVAGPTGIIHLIEAATQSHRHQIRGQGSRCVAMAFTPDGTRLLTAGGDHTVLVWDVRPQAVPLPAEFRRETNAAKLWATMCVGKAEASWLAMARLAAEPSAAIATARMRMKPATEVEVSPATRLQDSRAIELLESLRTPEAHDFLRKLAGGEAAAWRTQEAKRALERLGK